VDDGPQRVEIELTEAAPSRSRRRRRRDGAGATTQSAMSALASESPVDWSPPDSAVVVVGDSPPPPGGSVADGRRIVAIAGAVGVLALTVGWALGRSGGDGSARSVDATTTVEASTSDAAPSTTLIPGESIAPAEVPTTTRPRPSTTTTTTVPAEWVIEQVDIDPRLAESTDTIVAIGSPPRLIELDLGTGELRSLALPRVVTANVYSMAAGPDWTIFNDATTGQSLIVRNGETVPERTDLSIDNGTWWKPGTDLFWRIDEQSMLGQALVEVDVTGTPTGRTVETPNFWPSSVDVDGSLIVGDGVLGAYVVAPDGSFRLPGGVLALGDPGWLIRFCGDTIDSCGVAMVDRASRETRPLDVDTGRRRLDSAIWYGGGGRLPTISPDGRRALVYLSDEMGFTTGAALDLTTGELTEVPGGFGPSSYGNMTWSSDGRFVFLLEGGTPTAWDVDAGELFPITTPGPLSNVNVMTLRPTATTDEG
jgi:hypothetical protein